MTQHIISDHSTALRPLFGRLSDTIGRTPALLFSLVIVELDNPLVRTREELWCCFIIAALFTLSKLGLMLIKADESSAWITFKNLALFVFPASCYHSHHFDLNTESSG